MVELMDSLVVVVVLASGLGVVLLDSLGVV